MRCECGKELENTTGIGYYLYSQYDIVGNIVYAVCQHGCVVVNKLNNEGDIDEYNKTTS